MNRITTTAIFTAAIVGLGVAPAALADDQNPDDHVVVVEDSIDETPADDREEQIAQLSAQLEAANDRVTRQRLRIYRLQDRVYYRGERIRFLREKVSDMDFCIRRGSGHGCVIRHRPYPMPTFR